MNELSYIKLLHSVFEYGRERETRSGDVISIFGHHLEFNLRDGFPLLTTKKMFFKGIVSELAWFLRGGTNVKELHAHNNHIWDGNTKEREYDAGPIYGFQWRHFGATYTDCHADYSGQGIDQIQGIIDLIKSNPHSRRIFLSAWNPSMQAEMALPPCHVSYQFYVDNGILHCHMYQRSCDVFLGLPFNIASTALLTHLIAHETNLVPGNIRISLGDVHLYKSHIGVATIQMNRTPHPFPRLRILREKDGLWDVKLEEVVLEHYTSHGRLKAEMAV